jgi:hypothetical protein
MSFILFFFYKITKADIEVSLRVLEILKGKTIVITGNYHILADSYRMAGGTNGTEKSGPSLLKFRYYLPDFASPTYPAK